MAQVTVSINERDYQVICDDGQEAHVSRLGVYIDKRVGELVAAVGNVGDARLLVMVSLLLADELSEAYSDLDVAKATNGDATARLNAGVTFGVNIENLAKRIEDIAERLEKA